MHEALKPYAPKGRVPSLDPHFQPHSEQCS